MWLESSSSDVFDILLEILPILSSFIMTWGITQLKKYFE